LPLLIFWNTSYRLAPSICGTCAQKSLGVLSSQSARCKVVEAKGRALVSRHSDNLHAKEGLKYAAL